MKKLSLRRIHKYSALIATGFLIILVASGIFLNHKTWDFLYKIEIPNSYLPKSLKSVDNKLIQSYTYTKAGVLFASKKGIFYKANTELKYKKVLDLQTLSIREDRNKNIFYAGTSEGIYKSKDNGLSWSFFALDGLYVNSLSIYKNKLLVSIDKSLLILLSSDAFIISKTIVNIEKKELNESVSLSRLVRDLHYGRGIFDEDLSLYLNDFASFWILFLIFTGFMIYIYIRRIKKGENLSHRLKIFLNLHLNSLFLFAFIPIVLLVITGIFLDHSKYFKDFLKSNTVKNSYLPPVYQSLKADIWAVDLYKDKIRIGNRFGIYVSSNMKTWKLENKGFVYGLKRINNTLYISGMGSSNRIYTNNKYLKAQNTPHMYKDVNVVNEKIEYFSKHSKDKIPKTENSTLYAIFLSLHDGTFFASWWIFINDFVSVLLLILLFTGTIRWFSKKKTILKSRIKKWI
jgi:hypothetical protein